MIEAWEAVIRSWPRWQLGVTRGELPGRKVGRKWLTTRNALLRWIESSSENNTLARAIERGDRYAITTVLKSGKAQIKKR